jgi:hypothetical protein
MWWPRKPQPPITSTFPSVFFCGAGAGAIVTNWEVDDGCRWRGGYVVGEVEDKFRCQAETGVPDPVRAQRRWSLVFPVLVQPSTPYDLSTSTTFLIWAII